MTPHTRDRVLGAVALAPGASTRGIARSLLMDESSADYHLRRLRREGRVQSQRRGREVAWFAAGCGLCPVLRRALPHLRREEGARVAAALAPAPQTAVALGRRAGVRVGVVRWTAPLLVEAGLAQRDARGRYALRDGGATCVRVALAGRACGEWGRCPVSRALEAPPPPRVKARL